MLPGRTFEPLAGDQENFYIFREAFSFNHWDAFHQKVLKSSIMSHETILVSEKITTTTTKIRRNCRFISSVPHRKPPPDTILGGAPWISLYLFEPPLAASLCIVHSLSQSTSLLIFCSLLLLLVPQQYHYF